MKKILLSVLVLGTTAASAQTGIYVTSSGSVHVQPKTLVYSEGGLNVASDGTVVSDGHVQLNGDYTNASTTGANVQFMYTDTTSGNPAGVNTAYGQLIIADAATTSGPISMETPAIKNQTGAGREIAFPFKTGTSMVDVINGAKDASTLTSFGNTVVSTGTRYTKFAYYTDNSKRQVKEATATFIDPTYLYTLYTTQAGYQSAFTTADVVFAGVPNTGAQDVSIAEQTTGAGTKIESITGSDFATSKTYKNDFGEWYYTYVEDFIAGTSDSNWGHALYAFGNPYTSNISLTQLFADSSLTTTQINGIAIQATETDSDLQTGEGSSAAKYYVTTCGTADGSGIDLSTCDGDLSTANSNTGNIIVRPFGTFWVKFRDGQVGTTGKTLKFSDNIKVFDYEGLFIPIGTSVGNQSSNNSARVASSSRAKTSARTSTGRAIESLRLGMREGDEQVANVYISANPWATEEVDTQMDAAIEGTGRALSVLSEGVSEKKTLYINGISMNDYVGKPINLDVHTTAGKTYSFKGDVRINADTNLDNTNFYLEDKQTKRIVRVGSDFDYSYVGSNDDSERFVVYYGTAPVDVNEVVEEVKGKEINVAKSASGDDFIVFNGLTGTAKVMVYNVLGQLVYTDDQVSTNTNYSLNKLPKNSGVYIVKIIDEEGKTVSKKIVK